MKTEYDFEEVVGQSTVYVRPVPIDELPAEMRDQGSDEIYAVHNAEGERLALVKNRHFAFVLARQNDMSPVTVH